MMLTITRPGHVKAKLTPLIAALREIDGESVSYNPEAFESAAALLVRCERTLAAIDNPNSGPANDPLKDLPAKVALRALGLTIQIEAENRLGQTVLDQYQRDLTDLKLNGATLSQVRELEAEAKAKSEAHRLNVVELQAKKAHLDEFLATAPDYDLSLLSGTEFSLLEA
ncbi:hypothetical protein [Methylomonas sp. HYX-M1]|uniref:hypothetical protein n=1 Tax=Methylomonas sp. HYX-M1 TaxID=3139307 RepID=UPI00345B6881